MRGSPLIRALAAFLILLAGLPFLLEMTREAVAAPERPAAPRVAEREEIALALEFTHAPRRVRIVHLEKEIWVKENPATAEDVALNLPWPEEGVELVFAVEWPEAVELAAMRATMVDPQQTEIARSLWGSGSKTEVLNFP